MIGLRNASTKRFGMVMIMTLVSNGKSISLPIIAKKNSNETFSVIFNQGACVILTYVQNPRHEQSNIDINGSFSNFINPFSFSHNAVQNHWNDILVDLDLCGKIKSNSKAIQKYVGNHDTEEHDALRFSFRLAQA